MTSLFHYLLQENFIANNQHHINNFKLNYNLDKQKIQSQEAKKNINMVITKIKICLDMDKLSPDWNSDLDDNLFCHSVEDYIGCGNCCCYSIYGIEHYCQCDNSNILFIF